MLEYNKIIKRVISIANHRQVDAHNPIHLFLATVSNTVINMGFFQRQARPQPGSVTFPVLHSYETRPCLQVQRLSSNHIPLHLSKRRLEFLLEI